MTEFSTTVRTRWSNQLSTPWVTRTPNTSATAMAGTAAAAANSATNRRCRRAPASRARAATSWNTRQAAEAASAAISTRLRLRISRMVRLRGPTGPVTGADEAIHTATAVSSAARA